MSYVFKSLFLLLITYAIAAFATDSSELSPYENVISMHRTAHIDTNQVIPRNVSYTPDGGQILDPCPPDHSLVNIKNASKQVYWGPPEAICTSYGTCSFPCYCAWTQNSCCSWCTPPCTGYSEVKWQSRPTVNQASAIRENMPSVLSEAGCAPVKTTWESVS